MELDQDMDLWHLPEGKFIKQVALMTGETEETVRDMRNALISMNEEDELVKRWEGEGGA
jgi:hypothetical protein